METQTTVLDKKESIAIIKLKNEAFAFSELHQRCLQRINSAAQDFIRLGETLKEISEKKLYEVGGYSDIFDYGETALNLKKTSVVNYIAVYEKFGKAQIDSYGFPKLSYSQLVELLPVADNKELIDSIKPNTTIKAIRSKKILSKLSEDDQKLELMLSEEFKKVFFEWYQSLGMDFKFNAIYTPPQDSSLEIKFPGGNIEIKRQSDNSSNLFIFRANVYEYLYKSFDDLQGLKNILKTEGFKSFEKKLLESAKASKEKVADKKNKDIEPLVKVKRLFKNDAEREAYIKDDSHWILIADVVLGDNRRVRYYRFDLNNCFMLEQFNDQYKELRRWTDDGKYCQDIGNSYISVIVRYLKDEKI